jgi:hypothetical protein
MNCTQYLSNILWLIIGIDLFAILVLCFLKYKLNKIARPKGFKISKETDYRLSEGVNKLLGKRLK